MKTIKYILILFCATVGLLAQNNEPLPMKFKWGGSNLYRVFDTNATQFQQKEFLIGTQWGHTPKYYIGMNNNAAAGRFGKHSLDYMYEKPITTIYQPTLDWWFIAFRISPAMHYDPTLSVSDMNAPNFYPDDPTTSVFGFKERGVSSIQTIDNNRRLKINRNVWGVYNPSGNKILSGISEQPNFRTEFCISSQNEGLFGHRWFLSVNMRKLRNTFNNINQKLLTIKLKYKTDKSDELYTIRFDSVAIASPNAVDILPYNRGLQQKKVKVNRLTNEFVITNSMLPNINEDKTLTASFLTINPSPENEYARASNSHLINPEFVPGMPLRDYSKLKDGVNTNQIGYQLNSENYKFKDYKPDVPRIVWMDIEVYYHNATDIAIDYIKIESENAYYMSRGFVDDINSPNIRDDKNRYVHVIGDYNYKYCLDSHNVNNMPYNIWARPYSIKHTMQGWLNNEENSATISGTNTKLRQALRFYIQDTESEKPHFWWQLRYANLITNGLAVTRDLPYKHKLYKYYTKARNRYIGIKIQENENMVPSPAITFGHGGHQDQTYYMNLKYGHSIDILNQHRGQWGIDPLFEDPRIKANRTLYSNYETYLNLGYGDLPQGLQTAFNTIDSRNFCGKRLFDIARKANLNNPNEKKLFDEIVKQSGSIQIRWENSLRDKFYNHQDMLYSDDAWWMNYFLSPDYYQHRVDGVDIPQHGCSRFKTGEETRLLLYGSILKGAKGFFYDRECDFPYLINPGEYAGILGIGLGDNINNTDLNYLNGSYYPLSDYIPFDQYKAISSESVGNDFLNPNVDPSKMYSCIASAVPNIANALEVAQNRIYLGMRSTRTEVYKISQLIRRLEQNRRRNPYVYPYDLMDLRLVAWYGKGFTEMYSQHPSYNNGDLMNIYLDKNSIRTSRKLYPSSYYQITQYGNTELSSSIMNISDLEDIDSSFFDITILQSKRISQFNNYRYYIGIQNRRTDPLIWDASCSALKFYSTAEFEDKCNSNDEYTMNYFRNNFWKRLGCRRISFYVNRKKPNYDFDIYYSLQIQEILAQDTDFNNINSSWRSDPFCHKINYYVPFTNNYYYHKATINLLPGEGKLLFVNHIGINAIPSPTPIDPPNPIEFPIPTNYAFHNSRNDCLGSSDLYLRYDLVLDVGDSLEYDLLVVNNTQNDLKDLPILYRFLREDVNINLNEFVNHSNLHPDCYDENKLKRVSIIDSLPSKSQRQFAKIKVDRKQGLPELIYRFDILSSNGKPCDQVFINSDNHIKEYYGKGYKGKKANTYQSDFVSSLEVNPNPANDKLIVNFVSSNVSSYKLNIYDINGGMVYSHPDAISSAGVNELTLDISTLPVGVYNLILDINNDKISKKFSIDR